MTAELTAAPRRNWPLIWTIVVATLLAGMVVIGSVALYVANFNLLEWIE